MGLFCDFEADDNSITYWSITSAILALQLLITLLISVTQSVVLCCCKREQDTEDRDDKVLRSYTDDGQTGNNKRTPPHDPTDMENEEL